LPDASITVAFGGNTVTLMHVANIIFTDIDYRP